MSHPEQQQFLHLVSQANSHLLTGARVLEIGSYDVNGTTRKSFADASTYIGVDLTDGPGVDLVSYGHELDHPDGSYDVVLSAECFEHDPFWIATYKNMVRMCRPGGVVAVTCASTGRPEHGTSRTSAEQSPGTQAAGHDYYRNIGVLEFTETFRLEELFDEWTVWYNPTSFDLYFAGVRSGSSPSPRGLLPSSEAVRQLQTLMPLQGRLLRIPLRVTRLLARSEDRYQTAILPYWRSIQRLHALKTQS